VRGLEDLKVIVRDRDGLPQKQPGIFSWRQMIPSYSSFFHANDPQIDKHIFLMDDLDEVKSDLDRNKLFRDHFEEWRQSRDDRSKLKENRDLHAFFHKLFQMHDDPILVEGVKPIDRKSHQCDHLLFGSRLFYHTLHESYLESSKPDFSLFQYQDRTIGIESARSPLNVITIVELTSSPKLLSDHIHLGKQLYYNIALLNNQPEREYVISVLTNIDNVVFVRSLRKDNGICHEVSKSYESPLALFKVIQLLKSEKAEEKFGFHLPTILFPYPPPNPTHPVISPSYLTTKKLSLKRYISSGVSANVYTAVNPFQQSPTLASDDLVVKIFHNEDEFEEEKIITERIYQRLRDSLDHDFLNPRLVLRVNYDLDSHSIIYYPFGYPLPKTPCYALEMCKCLAVLRQIGVVHRDIRPTHFVNLSLTTGQPHLMLIDFGFSYVIPSTSKREPILFKGSSHFCPTHILCELTRNPFYHYIPELSHDLESLVKSIFCLSNRELENELRLCGHDLEKTRQFWEKYEQLIQKTYWNELLEYARQDQFDELVAKLGYIFLKAN
jgi:hypothetical protein